MRRGFCSASRPELTVASLLSSVLSPVLPSSSYKALGLLSSLAPHLHGGIEKDIYPASSPLNPNNPLHPNNLPISTDPNYIPKGYGRLVRDADGKVIDVVMSTEEDDADAAEGSDVKGKGKAVPEKEDTVVVKGACIVT